MRKVDVASVTTIPTQKEKKYLDKILKSRVMMGKLPPNRCISVYKNRGGKYNMIKIWLYVELGTMRVHDLFCTNNDYEIIDDIPQTFVEIREDQKVFRTSSKEEIGAYKTEKTDERDEEEEISEPENSSVLTSTASEAIEAFSDTQTTEAFDKAIETGEIDELEDEEDGEDMEDEADPETKNPKSFNAADLVDTPEYENFNY